MKLRKQTIDDVVLRDKRVIIRADFNVPLDDEHQITDDTRIRSTLPTINRAVDDGAKVILCSHLGRPNGKVNPKYSLAPVAKRLGRLMGKNILFAPDCIGPAVEGLVEKMKVGDVLLLENLRFHPGEEQNDDAFSKALAALGDVYINDAFGAAHRAHASTVGITRFIPLSVAGFLQERNRVPRRSGRKPRSALCCDSRGSESVGKDRRHRKSWQAGRQSHYRRWHGLYLPEGERDGNRQLSGRERHVGLCERY